MTKTITLRFRYSTPNKHRYDGVGKNCPVEAFYIRRRAFPGTAAPKTLHLTISDE